MKSKKIYILIGPKGSGKSFIGILFDKYFQIDFLRVEDWVKELKKGRNIDNEEYVKEVFQTIENRIRQSLNKIDNLVFESTGLTEHFDRMLSSLQSDFKVITIKVNTDTNVCLNRIRSRDQSIHIEVSDEQIYEINAAVLAKNWNSDFEIENSNKTIDELKTEIKKIIKCSAPNKAK